MEQNNPLQISFHVLCLIVTFCMIVYGTVRFVADESNTVIDAKNYHETEEDIYPSFSLCLEIDTVKLPWSEKLKKTGWLQLYDQNIMTEEYGIDNESKLTDYIRFLMGNDTMSNEFIGVENMNRVDYDKVTPDLGKYVKEIKVRSGRSLVYQWSLEGKSLMPFYVSYRHPLLKCFSVDLSKEALPHLNKGSSISFFQVEVDNKNKVFGENSDFNVAYFLHYPKQLMRSSAIGRDNLKISAGTFRKVFQINNMEVLRRRYTTTSHCASDEAYKDDDLIRKRLVEMARCTPSHWSNMGDYPKCTTFHQMAQVVTPDFETTDPTFLRQFNDNPGKPCSQMFSISYTTDNLIMIPEEKRAKGTDHASLSNQSQLPNENNDGTNLTGDHNLKKKGDYENPSNTWVSAPMPPEHPHNGPPKRKGPSSHINGSPPNGQLLDSPPTGSKLEKSLDTTGHVARKRPKHPNPRGQKPGAPDTRQFAIEFRTPHYKEIKHVQAFNIESFIGNVGGYVGLFIGVAVWQAPELIEFLYGKIKWTVKTFL